MSTHQCPWCNRLLLRHLRQNRLYWFCQGCWQEVPVLLSDTLPIPKDNLASQPQELRKVSLRV
ncbi:MAG: hypothetical protein KME26_03565 [Oscillatoria princeps RMCB-10]|jgi:hypothetical protein|nr:hypothetical protein [Oscillatoria princeps RMCB-10]